MRGALGAIRETRGTLEVLAKMLGLMKDRKQVDVRVVGRFIIGQGYVDEPEPPGQGSRVINGHVDEIPPRARNEDWPIQR